MNASKFLIMYLFSVYSVCHF